MALQCAGRGRVMVKVGNQLLVKYRGRGIGKKTAGKIKLVTRMLDNGFDLAAAAAHDNCPSAQYFLNSLRQSGRRPREAEAFPPGTSLQ
jgi:hypothetical protein